MTTTVERPAVEDRTGTDLLEREQLRRVEERPSREVLPPRKAPPFVRWLAWIVGILLVAGTAGLVWWNVTTSEELVAPPIASIDPHQSPEILRTQVPGPVAPSIASIDPHQSPEILRTQVPGPAAPSIASIDPHQSPEILRIQVLAPVAPSIASIDPHQSPEVVRIQVPEAVTSPSTGWSLQTLELLDGMRAQPSTGWSLQTLELLRSMPALGD